MLKHILSKKQLYGPVIGFFYLLFIPGWGGDCLAQKKSKLIIQPPNREIDSLISKARVQQDLDSAIKLCKGLLKRSLQENYQYGIALAQIGIGDKIIEKGHFEEGLNYIKQAYPYCLKSTERASLNQYYCSVALYYTYQGDYVTGADNYYKALEELKKVIKTPDVHYILIYLDLANVYMALKQYDRCYAYLKAGETIARKGNYPFQLANFINNLGAYYIATHKYDSATRYFLEGLALAKKNHTPIFEAGADINLGEIYIETDSLDKAIEYLLTGLNLIKDYNPYYTIEASFALGDAWTRQRKYAKAKNILFSTLGQARALKMKDEVLDGEVKLLDLYKATRQYKKAVACQDTISLLKDSLLGAENAKAISRMEIRYKTAEKDKEIADSKLLIEQQKNKLTKRKESTISTVNVIALLTVILIWLYGRSRHKQNMLAQQVRALQQGNKIEVMKAIMSGEENERKRLARELHDGIGGMVSSAMMQYTALPHEYERLTVSPAYNDILNLLNEIGEEVRKTAHNLMPEVLLKQPLQEAIRSYCNYIQKKNSFRINFHCHGTFDNVSEALKLNIYRIVQELLKNISQHAHATSVLVQLHRHDQILTVTVEDNGKGFNAQEVKNGMGLDNLQARVHHYDGQYSVSSDPGKGTSVYIEFDLEHQAANKIT